MYVIYNMQYNLLILYWIGQWLEVENEGERDTGGDTQQRATGQI